MIRDFTSPKQWRFVDTNSNPADDASRGLSAVGLLQQQRWTSGPQVSWKSETEWPQQPFPVGEVPDDDPEVRKVVSASTMVKEDSAASVNKLIEYHSSWYRLKLSVAVFLRIKNVLRKRMETRRRASQAANCDHGQASSESKGVDDCCTSLRVQEFEDAEITILRFVQSQSFSARSLMLLDELVARTMETNGVGQSERKWCSRKKVP